MNAELSINGMYGMLTTDHAASSYGRPVLVMHDDGRTPQHMIGVAFGPVDAITYDNDISFRGEWSESAADFVRRGHVIDGDRTLVAKFV